MLWQHRARRVAKYASATLQGGGCWLPAATEPVPEKGGGVRFTREDGDRRHRSESRRVEHEIREAGRLEDDVVRVLVLRHDDRGGDRWSEFSSPLEQVAQRV